MTATSLRHELDGPDAGVVHVAIPWGCHTPRVAFLTNEPRVLLQLAQSRRAAQTAVGGTVVSWTEGEVAIRVDLADSAPEITPPSALSGSEVPVAPAAAAAAPAPTSRPVTARRRRRTSGTLNLSRGETTTLERGVELLLEAHHQDLDRDELLSIKTKLGRLPHVGAEATD